MGSNNEGYETVKGKQEIQMESYCHNYARNQHSNKRNTIFPQKGT